MPLLVRGIGKIKPFKAANAACLAITLFLSFGVEGSDRAPREKENSFFNGGLKIKSLFLAVVQRLPSLFHPRSTHRVPGDSALARGAGLAGVLGLLDRGLERRLGLGLGDD